MGIRIVAEVSFSLDKLSLKISKQNTSRVCSWNERVLGDQNNADQKAFDSIVIYFETGLALSMLSLRAD